tara:strand:- start:249 stop:416 length:168 start_codon:yes stop_codon:yes gene_type:complete
MVEMVHQMVVTPMVAVEAVAQVQSALMVSQEVPVVEEMDHLYLQLWELLMEPQVR